MPSRQDVPPASLLRTLLRFMERRIGRQGAGAAVEAVHPAAEADRDVALGRRDRRLRVPQEILDRSLAQKVLHGWLQNRHQVLVPLTFRLGRLEPADIDLLMRFTATALLNASSGGEAARRSVERWLRGIGAGEDAVAAFHAALREPAPLSELVAEVRERELAPYAYASAVVAADTQDLSGRLFANYIGARLALPADAVRSIDRRYRR